MDDTMNTPVLPVHPFTGLTAIAVLPSGRVVWPVLGGASDDQAEPDPVEEQPEDEDTPDAGDDTGDTGSAGEEAKPKDDMVSRAELAKVIAARDTAKRQLRELRQELEKLQRANETAEETARREAAEEAQRKADAKYKPISVRASLLEAGVKPSRVKGALRLINLDEIEIDEDGEVTGLDSQVAALREEWPELFADYEPKPEPRRPVRGVDGADKKAPPKRLTASELQAMKLLGKR